MNHYQRFIKAARHNRQDSVQHIEPLYSNRINPIQQRTAQHSLQTTKRQLDNNTLLQSTERQEETDKET